MDFGISLVRRRTAAQLDDQESQSLGVCPSCASGLVQPQSWNELPGGALFLRLRCPECLVVTSGTFTHERVAVYDATLVEGREAILAAYEAVVRHNMEELLDRFHQALERDLISADDFELGPAARASRLEAATLQLKSP